MRTRQQEWAQRAFANVSSMKGKDKESKEKYQIFCKRFPSMIHGCGLCQALAFARAKNQDVYLDHLQVVLERQDLEQKSRESDDLSEYQRLTREALLAATWLKRYAESLLKVKENSHVTVMPKQD